MTAFASHPVTPAEVEAWLKQHIAGLIGTTPDRIGSDASFESFGIDSAQAVMLVAELEEWLQLSDELPLELLFEERTIADAARRVAAAQGAKAVAP